jgi:hypothetical protein
MIEERGQVVVSGVRFPLYWQRRLAETPDVVANDPKVVCQRLRLAVPMSAISGVAVDENERVAGSGGLIVEPSAWNLCKAGLHLKGSCPSLATLAAVLSTRSRENGAEDECERESCSHRRSP